MLHSLNPSLGEIQRQAHARQAIVDLAAIIARLDPSELDRIAEILATALTHQKKISLIGNGGSCAAASHLATDLTLMARQAGIRASIEAPLNNAALLSAMTNDYGFAESGAAFVETSCTAGDVLMVFSCSGRSVNLVKAAQSAARLGVQIILVGAILAPPDFPASERIIVDSTNYSIIEVVHSAIAHIVVDLLRIRFGAASPRHPQLFPSGVISDAD